MYCFISKTCLLATALCTLCLVQAAFAQREGGPDFLEITSQQGYSRLEIEDNNIVVFFTGGLEFTYLDMALSAYELRYTRKTKVAEVSGGVSLTVDGASINCEGLTLNGEAGAIESNGPATATLGDDRGITIVAESLVATFEPNSEISSAEDLQFSIPGKVDLTDAAGNRFNAANVTYDNGTGFLSSPGEFAIDLKLKVDPKEYPGFEDFEAEELIITGTGLSGQFTPEGEIQSLSFNRVQLEGEHLEAGADTGLLEPVPGYEDRYTLVLAGSPVSGGARNDKTWVEFSAKELQLELAEGEINRIELSREAVVTTPDASFNSETILLDHTGDGYLVSVPGRFSVGLDLLGQGGGTVISVEKINNWFGN